MKRKILVGLLSVAACFSLGSTSFASSISANQVTTSSISESSQLSTNAVFQATINLKAGEMVYVTGYSFWYVYNDDYCVDFSQAGLIVGSRPGTSIIGADFGNGNVMHYTVVVTE